MCVVVSRPVTDRAVPAPDAWSVERVTAILDLLRDGVLVIDAEDVVQYVNPVASERLGASPDALVGARLSDLLGGLEGSTVPDRLAELHRTGGAVDVEEYVPALHGWFHMVASADAGEITIFVRDVTGQLRAERHRRLVECIDDAVADTTALTVAVGATAHVLRTELGFDLAEVWMCAPDGAQLRLVAIEHAAGHDGLRTYVTAMREQQLDPMPDVVHASTSAGIVTSEDITDGGAGRDLLGAADLRAGLFVRIDIDRGDSFVIGLLRSAPLGLDDASAVFDGIRSHVSSALARRRAQLEVEQFFLLSREYVAITGLDGRYRRLNPAMVAGLGYADEAAMHAIGAVEMLHPDDRARTADAIVGSSRTGEPIERLENRILAADGQYRWISWTAQTFQDEDVLFAAGRDVTADREQRLLREAQNDVLRGIVADVPLATTLTHLAEFVEHVETQDPGVSAAVLLREGGSGTVRDVSLRVVAAPSLPDGFVAEIDGVAIGSDAGPSAEAAHRQTTVVIDDLATDARWEVHREAALTHGLAACWSVPILGTDDRVLGTFTVYARTAGAPSSRQLERVGDVVGLAGVAIDRSRSARALVESESRLRLLAEVMTDGIFDLDPGEGRWRTRAFHDLFGHQLDDEIVDDSWWIEHLHPEERDGVVAGRDRALASDTGLWQSEHRFARADGSYASALIRGRIVRDGAGRSIRVVGGVSDVTERRDLERQYLRAQRVESLGTLAGGIAHDLNNSLMPILMATELLAEEPLTDDVRETVEVIALSARRSAEMVRNILTYARGVDGSPVVLDVGEIVRMATRLLRDTLPKDVRLAVPDPPEGIRVRGDVTQLHQVVMNLALNARDAMPDGGILRIGLDQVEIEPGGATVIDGCVVDLQPGRYARIRVSDTGTGISPAIRDRLFEPFFTTKARAEGTGLGLPTALAIARSHGGSLAVVSEAGAGSTFDLLLPVVAGRAADGGPAAAPRMEAADGEGQTVLVVDDEVVVRAVVRDVLETAGYRVVEAANGAEALRLASARFCSIITDVMMPVMDGVEMLERLRRSGNDLPVVAMTGVADDHRVASLVELGVATILTKPFDRDTLLGAVAEACRRV